MKAFVEISAEVDKRDVVVGELEKMTEIGSILTTTEEFNIIARIRDGSFSQLNQIIDAVNNLDGVKATRPVMVPV